jgi:hypothetical protein
LSTQKEGKLKSDKKTPIKTPKEKKAVKPSKKIEKNNNGKIVL